MLLACQGELEQRAIYIGVCAGLRSTELRSLRGQHFQRPGFIWVSADIAKGGRERWVPVIADLQTVVNDVLTTVGDDEFVLPAQRWRDPGTNTERRSLSSRPMSAQALYYLVGRVAARAGIQAHVHPHLMRHAYGDHIAKHAGLLIAQAVLGHASVETTRSTYVGRVTLDELAAAVNDVSYTQIGLPPAKEAQMPRKAPTRFELVQTAPRPISRDLGGLLLRLREAFANAV
jgi:integrase